MSYFQQFAKKRRRPKAKKRPLGDMLPLSRIDGKMAIVCIPHPSMDMSLNSNAHWSTEYKEKKQIREQMGKVMMTMNMGQYDFSTCPIRYGAVWFYRGNVADDDNISGRMKVPRDCFADRIGRNDREFKLDDVLFRHNKDLVGIAAMIITFDGTPVFESFLESIAASITQQYTEWHGARNRP